ncbi:MAG: type II toxin-antitoxin system RelE/ParE family toxin [Pseudomonadota bacterium]
MKHIYKTRTFSRWMRKTPLEDHALFLAIQEMEQGLVDADLGGGVYKKRVPLPNRGKSGSTRTIIATNRSGRWFYLFGFEKGERDNITKTELAYLKNLADVLLTYSEEDLRVALATEQIIEVQPHV